MIMIMNRDHFLGPHDHRSCTPERKMIMFDARQSFLTQSREQAITRLAEALIQRDTLNTACLDNWDADDPTPFYAAVRGSEAVVTACARIVVQRSNELAAHTMFQQLV
jgi:hypothetical protein